MLARGLKHSKTWFGCAGLVPANLSGRYLVVGLPFAANYISVVGDHSRAEDKKIRPGPNVWLNTATRSVDSKYFEQKHCAVIIFKFPSIEIEVMQGPPLYKCVTRAAFECGVSIHTSPVQTM